MKSRKVKAYNARKKFKPDLTLDESDSDVNPDTLFHDEIDELNNERDDELSTDDELIHHRDESSGEEEVLPITDDEREDSVDEDLEKDESDGDDDIDLPNREAWGKKKSAYYSADFVDEDRGRTYREEDAEAAKAEAEEAYAIQKSVYSNILADNLGANLFLEGSGESSDDEEKVDLISATKEEKLKYLKTETQILEVSREFKPAIQELKRFSRLVNLIETKKIKSEEFEKYIRIKNGLLSLYCLNLCLYMMFASTNKNLKYHPVLQRIASYKQLLEDLKSTDSVAGPIIDIILEKESCGEEIEFNVESANEENLELINYSASKNSDKIAPEEKTMKIPKTIKHLETENEKQVMSLIEEVKNEMKKRKYEENEDEEKSDNEIEPPLNQEENVDEKRMINYQIAKNKGLVPHRKKEYRNPRVRHRMKYRKAQIRRKGQVRGVYKEIKRYEGEPTGINTNVVKSIKFK